MKFLKTIPKQMIINCAGGYEGGERDGKIPLIFLTGAFCYMYALYLDVGVERFK